MDMVIRNCLFVIGRIDGLRRPHQCLKAYHSIIRPVNGKSYQRTGHLFQGRYKALLIDVDNYLLELIRYIHLNTLCPFARTGRLPVSRANRLSLHPG
jgi:hypothetical protein